MTEQEPEASGEIEIQFEADDIGIKIAASLDDASILVEHSWDAAEAATTLVVSLPQILAAVQEQLNATASEEPT